MVGGIALAISGLRPRRPDAAFVGAARRAPGTISELRWETHGRHGHETRMAFPIVRFTPAGGQAVEVRTSQGRAPAPARKGQAVTVLYDPEDPSRALVEDLLGQGRAIGLGMAVFGVLIALVGVAGTAIVMAVLRSAA